MTTGKTIALTIWNFVGKVMSLLFNMLSRFVIAFLTKSKRLLISWLQSWSTMMMETKKIKSVTVSSFSLSICHEVMRWHEISFLNVEFQQVFHSFSLSSSGSLITLHFMSLGDRNSKYLIEAQKRLITKRIESVWLNYMVYR